MNLKRPIGTTMIITSIEVKRIKVKAIRPLNILIILFFAKFLQDFLDSFYQGFLPKI